MNRSGIICLAMSLLAVACGSSGGGGGVAGPLVAAPSGPAAQPDIVARLYQPNSGSFNTGSIVPYTMELENTGAVVNTATFVVGFYQSLDRVIDPTDDILFDFIQVGPVPVGAKITEADIQAAGNFLARAVTPTLLPGSLTLAAIADVTNVFAEQNEGNNTAIQSGATSFIQTTGPDLCFTGVNGLPAQLFPGGNTVLFSIANAGDAAVSPDPDIRIEFVDGTGLSSVTLINLAGFLPSPGTSRGLNLTLTTSSQMLPGPGRIIITLDPSNVVTEGNETNNVLSGVVEFR